MDELKIKNEASTSPLYLKLSELDKSSGRRVTPYSVRASDLAELITSFEEAVLSMAADSGNFDLEEPDDDAEISLVSIGEGSNILGLAVSPIVRPSAINIIQALMDGDFRNIPTRCYLNIKNIYRQVVKLGWILEIKGERDFDFRVASISKDHPIPELKRRIARGGTNIYGTLIRLGNNKPSARIKLSDRTTISVEMTYQMVKDLESRKRLYHVVGFEGDATWAVEEDWKIIEFHATRIIGYQDDGSGLPGMFDALANSAQDRWDGVDPVKFVNWLRGR